MERLKVYIDGASKGNPFGAAGIGVYIKELGTRVSKPIGLNDINFAELSAALEALNILTEKGVDVPVEVFSDSQDLISGVNHNYDKWAVNNFRNKYNKPIKDPTLWVELMNKFRNSKLDIKWTHVKAHDKCDGNNIADELAQKGCLLSTKPISKCQSASQLSHDELVKIVDNLIKAYGISYCIKCDKETPILGDGVFICTCSLCGNAL